MVTRQAENVSAASPTSKREKIRVGVYGATGYTGNVLMSLLARHPHVQTVFGTSESTREPLEGVALMPSEEAPLSDVDCVFLCLHNGVSGAWAARAVDAGVRVIDLSADLRLDSPDMYRAAYKQEPPAPQLLPAPFGLPEIHRKTLINAKYIANPGCHVTATLLALYPLAKAGALAGGAIIADTKTGISGAGKALKMENMFVEVYGDVRPYNAGRKHRHVPEIEQELHKLQPDAGQLIFTPHVIPMDVGLLSTVYAPLKPDWNAERVQAAFAACYDSEPLVTLLPFGSAAQVKPVAHKNHAIVAVTELVGTGSANTTANTAIITSAIDNLRKGAASQAVQNFNLMYSLPETAGLI
jgi:N-acetyl-gamma-glutamyl-phosphate reductase